MELLSVNITLHNEVKIGNKMLFAVNWKPNKWILIIELLNTCMG